MSAGQVGRALVRDHFDSLTLFKSATTTRCPGLEQLPVLRWYPTSRLISCQLITHCRRSLVNFSMVVSGSASVTYLLDAHGHNALHCLALSNFAKNMLLYGSTFFANGIVINRGVKFSLLVLGGCQAACWLASVPMYIYGKRVRSYVSIICFRNRYFILSDLSDRP